MKSILTAVWLLTVAFGNVIVIIIAESGGNMKQMVEYFIYSGVMYITTFIFIIMCMFYKYVEPRAPEEAHTDSLSSTSDGDQVTGKENMAFSVGDEEKAIESPGYEKLNMANNMADNQSTRSETSSDSETKF